LGPYDDQWKTVLTGTDQYWYSA